MGIDEIVEGLWVCPVCSAEHPAPVIVCRRCECQILLLNKIKLTAYQLRQQGYVDLGLRFYDLSSF
jgi:ribosomal protein L40E